MKHHFLNVLKLPSQTANNRAEAHGLCSLCFYPPKQQKKKHKYLIFQTTIEKKKVGRGVNLW